MIYVTYDQVEAMTLADRIVILRDGMLEQIGTPKELYHDPDKKFVAGFLGTPKISFLACTTTRPSGKKQAVLDTDPPVAFDLPVDVPPDWKIEGII